CVRTNVGMTRDKPRGAALDDGRRRPTMNDQVLADRVLEADPDLPVFMLGRLASLLARQVASPSLTERQALGQAVLATFLDCLDLGLAEQACAIVDQVSDGVVPGELVA